MGEDDFQRGERGERTEQIVRIIGTCLLLGALALMLVTVATW